MQPIFSGIVREDGTCQLDDREAFCRHVRSLAGKRIETIVRPVRSQRSGNQNRYYHGVIVKMLAEQLGYDPDEMHDALRAKFLSTPAEGDGLPHVRSTASLSTAEFEDYLERVRRWASEFLSLYIPLPNEVDAA